MQDATGRVHLDIETTGLRGFTTQTVMLDDCAFTNANLPQPALDRVNAARTIDMLKDALKPLLGQSLFDPYDMPVPRYEFSHKRGHK